MIVGKTFGAVNASDIAKAIHPKGQRIDDAFGEYDFRRFETARIPDAAMRPGQVEMPQ